MRSLVAVVVLGLGCLAGQPGPPAGMMFNPDAELSTSSISISSPAHTRQGAWVGEAIGDAD